MLQITIPEQETYDEKTQKFIKVKSCNLKLEHSVLSLWKWESKHHKYFINNENLSIDEIIDYIKCMTLNQVDEYYYNFLTEENLDEIKKYLKDPMTATWFSDDGKPGGRRNNEIITAEVIYASMIVLGIPVDIFEKRHINHVLTLIRVCNEKENPDVKKENPNDTLRRYSELNKARKAAAKSGLKR